MNFFSTFLGVNIAERLKETVKEWNVPDDHIAGVVRDNGANIVLGVSLVGWPDIPCFGHTLQLCVESGLNLAMVSRLVGAAKKLVGHFKHSSLAMGTLKEKQKTLNIPEHTLIQSVATRWNSTYFMLERLLKQRWAIYGVLHDETVSKPDHKRLDLKDEEWELASQLIVVLKPLQVATTALCEEHNVSVSLVYPVVYGLLKKHLAPASDDRTAVKVFKKTVASELKRRFDPDSEEIAEDPPVLASALDPRYHQLKFFSSEQRSVTYNKLKDLAVEVDAEAQTVEVEAETQESTAKRPRHDSAMDFLLGDSLGNGDDDRSPQDEVDLFLREPVLGTNTNPLKWWQANESRFPVLSKLAKRLLCIPATSVPAERIFSTSGLIVNKQRASLKPENVDMLVFLNRNLPSKASPVV